mgnify:FL=1
MSFLHHIFAFDSNSPLLFTQFYFWAFFAIVYAVFALVMEAFPKARGKGRLHLRNIFLLFVSWFFYYKTSGIFLLILAFVTLSDWLIAKQIYRCKTASLNRYARCWLVLSVIIDLGLLAYFKYAYFFTDMLNNLFGCRLEVFDIFAYIGNGFSENGRFMVDRIVLPVGISFYIFQVISYTADVFHGRIRPVRNLLDFGFYVSFFPQLVAGPIVRAEEFVPQLYRPFRLSKKQFGLAVFWILNGLAKKIILSDYLAVNFIDRVFDNPLLFSGFENLFALFAYSLQVYADFSGYTDIAIGVAMLLGFYLPKNFDSPYKAENPQQFWRRWHISLSRWLKTYLYIPLGGNRNATFGTYFWIALIALVALVLTGSWAATGVIVTIAVMVLLVAVFRPDHRKLLYANLNSFIVMLLGGLWHGASWNFMIWGGLNGIGMIVNKFWRIMNWHVRMLLMTLLAAGLVAADRVWSLPALRLFMVWAVILWIGTAVRYIYYLTSPNLSVGKENRTGTNPSLGGGRDSRGLAALSRCWAIAQTFTFITFTRLFFRSGSNLDPATANQEAWETATNMVSQIGGAWNSAIIPSFLYEYRAVVLLFVAGMVVHWLPDKWKQWYRIHFAMFPLWAIMLCVVVAVFIIYQFVTADMQPFIYFQF